jgi:hypothetical protein
VPEYIENGVVILQYADDTILCIQDDKEQATNLKLLLYIYEMSGLKINFSKSEVIMASEKYVKGLGLSNIFSCAIGRWSIKYLGVPFLGSRLHVADWIPIEEKMFKRLDGSQGSSLSLGGRLVLINSSLSNITMYDMSMYCSQSQLSGKGTLLEKNSSGRGRLKRKYYLIKWARITKPK